MTFNSASLPSFSFPLSLGDSDPEPHSFIIRLPSADRAGPFQDTDLCESSPGLVATLFSEAYLLALAFPKAKA